MLKKLSIQNLAIIEDITIDFEEKMTSLTGETGAGKSLIIDSLGLLLGERADSDMIRYQCPKATILGVFSITNDLQRAFLERIGSQRSEIEIFREITQTKKNTIKVNGNPISLAELKTLGSCLCDIHAQHETLGLINPLTYLDLLDKFGKEELANCYEAYQISFFSFQEASKKFEDAGKKNQTMNEKVDYLKYQVSELEGFHLIPNEDNELEEYISQMSNFDKMNSHLNQSYEALGNFDNIYECQENLKAIEDLNVKFKDFKEKLLDFYYQIEDIKGEIKDSIDHLDFDQEALNQAISRLDELKNLKKKYKMSLEELIAYLEKIKEEINMNENFDEYLSSLKKIYQEKKEELYSKGLALHNIREKVALKLSKELIRECRDIDLENMRFLVSFQVIPPINELRSDMIKENGFDTIDFMLSLNEGEPLRSLSKSASGGELSRIMLSLKKIFAHIQGLSLMVFDEIDSGISGEAARKMALKIHEISLTTQVLSITHLPHVASIANQQIYIYKETIDGRTRTSIKKLSFDERVVEIAHMMCGKVLSPYAMENAKELLMSEKLEK